jgi:hypothetical protein
LDVRDVGSHVRTTWTVEWGMVLNFCLLLIASQNNYWDMCSDTFWIMASKVLEIN